MNASLINKQIKNQLTQKSAKDEKVVVHIFFLIRKHQNHDYACKSR